MAQMMAIPIPTDTPAVSGPPNGQWNLEAWETLPDDGCRYEIIDGIPYFSSLPSTFHQWILMTLAGKFLPLDGKQFEIMIARGGTVLTQDTVVQADMVLFMKGRSNVIWDRYIYGTPDFVVEIISPGCRVYDERIKRDAYEKAGVPEYALIDPESRTLILYMLGQDGSYSEPVVYQEGQQVAFACVPEISFKVGDLFAGSPDTTL